MGNTEDGDSKHKAVSPNVKTGNKAIADLVNDGAWSKTYLR